MRVSVFGKFWNWFIGRPASIEAAIPDDDAGPAELSSLIETTRSAPAADASAAPPAKAVRDIAMRPPRQSLPAAVKQAEAARPARRRIAAGATSGPVQPSPVKPLTVVSPEPRAASSAPVPRPAAAPAAAPSRSTSPTVPVNFPGFQTSAIDRPMNRSHGVRQLAARLALREVFSPSQPVTERGRFAGRLAFLADLISTIEERLSHVVLYGPRGMGKTSLLHILTTIARESQYRVIYGSCSAQTRFDDMFRTFLNDIPLRYLNSVSPGDAEVGGASLGDRLPAGTFDARQLSELLANVAGTRVIIILDEFDRVESPEFRQSIAELIKNLSDRTARVQLILSGVAANLTELIGYIPSIRRNVIGMPIPRMTRAEIETLIGMGESAAGMAFDADSRDLIVATSNGSPYLVRLLCHHAALAALDEDRMTVGLADTRDALDRIIAESDGRMDRRVAHAARHLPFEQQATMLAAIALADATADGWFSPEDVYAKLDNPADRDAVIGAIEKLFVANGLVVPGEGSHSGEYRFVDEGLPVFVWINLARSRERGRIAGGKPDAAKAVEAG